MTDVSTMPMPARALTVKAFGITDKGKVRTSNEDQFLIADLTKSMRVWQTSLPEPKMQVGEEHADPGASRYRSALLSSRLRGRTRTGRCRLAHGFGSPKGLAAFSVLGTVVCRAA